MVYLYDLYVFHLLMEQNNQADFVLGKGRIIIDNDVVQILSEKDEKEVVQAMDDIKNRLLELSDDSYIHIVPPNTAAERAYLLPKTDKALENYEKRDKTGRPLFGVVVGEADSNRPVFTVERKNIPEGEEPITLEDLAQIERSHIKMKELLAIESIWHFFSYLKNTLGIDEKRLTLIHKAVPEGGWKIRNRSKRHIQRDYLEFLSHIWPNNTELLDAYDALREEEKERSKKRQTERQELKKWHALSTEEKVEGIKKYFPEERWISAKNNNDLKQLAADIKAVFGIGQSAFQSFMSDISPERPEEYHKVPGGTSQSLTIDRLYHFYKVLFGKTHPDNRFKVLDT